MPTMATNDGKDFVSISRTQLRRLQRQHAFGCYKQGSFLRVKEINEKLHCENMLLTGEAKTVTSSIATHRSDCDSMDAQFHYAANSNNAARAEGYKTKEVFKQHRLLHASANKVKHDVNIGCEDGVLPPIGPPPLKCRSYDLGHLDDPAIQIPELYHVELLDMMIAPRAFIPFTGMSHALNPAAAEFVPKQKLQLSKVVEQTCGIESVEYEIERLGDPEVKSPHHPQPNSAWADWDGVGLNEKVGHVANTSQTEWDGPADDWEDPDIRDYLLLEGYCPAQTKNACTLDFDDFIFELDESDLEDVMPTAELCVDVLLDERESEESKSGNVNSVCDVATFNIDDDDEDLYQQAYFAASCFPATEEWGDRGISNANIGHATSDSLFKICLAIFTYLIAHARGWAPNLACFIRIWCQEFAYALLQCLQSGARYTGANIILQTQEIWAILRNPVDSWLCLLAKWARESIDAVKDCSRRLGKCMCHGIGKTINAVMTILFVTLGLRESEPAEAIEGPRVVSHTAYKITAKMRRQTFTQP
jgi:hypothetical protein